MTEDKKLWDSSQLRKYDLHLEQIPRLDHNDPMIDDFIKEIKPFIITGCKLVKPAEKWTLNYLEKTMGNNDFTVYLSRDHKFKYYDTKKIGNCKDNKTEFSPPMIKVDMKFPEFTRRLREWKRGEDRMYLQQSLNSTVGSEIVHDFIQFDWDFCNGKQKKHNWGSLTSNLVLVAQEGNVTPCHYDEQENLFAQVQGYKRFILFPPEQFDCLYPYPVHHPHDRQSQVDFDQPDYAKFPKFKDARGFEGVVGPGEVLYIPIYWWHHVESLMRGGPTISITFWYKAGPTGQISYPLKDHQKVAIMRNIEKMLLEALQDSREVGPLLRALVLGRYTE